MKIVIEVTQNEMLEMAAGANSMSEVDEWIREYAEKVIGDAAWDAEIRVVK